MEKKLRGENLGLVRESEEMNFKYEKKIKYSSRFLLSRMIKLPGSSSTRLLPSFLVSP